MRNRIDNILLGLLWLLAATLATSFWMNTNFGFNMFSIPHWQYMGYLQASHTPIKPSFYISLGIAAFITFFGLYILLQPRFNRKRLHTQTNANPAPQINTPPTPQQPQPQNHIATPAPTTIPVATQPSAPIVPPAPVLTPEQNATPVPAPAPQPTIPVVPLRPPRLNLPTLNQYTTAPTPPDTQPTPVPQNTQSQDTSELNNIFTAAGYVVKKTPFIAGFKPALLAIGTDEVLYLGAIGTDTATLHRATDKLNEIFTDTLEDILINITGFVISPSDAAAPEYPDIMTFASLSDVRTYIQSHQNQPPSPQDQETFDAYSEYIDTVISYIGNL